MPRCQRLLLRAVWTVGLCVTACQTGAAMGTDTPARLRLGVLSMQPPDRTTRDYADTVEQLRRALPEHQVHLVPLDWHALAQAVEQQQLDWVLTNGVQYITLREQNALSGALATQRIHENGSDVATRGAVVLRRADRTDLAQFAQLHNKRLTVALPALRSQGLISYLGPMAELAQAQVPTQQWRWLETGRNQTLVVQHVLEGQADLGFVRTGLLEDMVRSGALAPGALEVVNPQTRPGYPVRTSTTLYPEWALAALPHVDEHTSRRVTAALLSMEHPSDPAHHNRVAGFTIPADYSTIENHMRLLRLPPFDRAPAVTWQDIQTQYRWTLLGAAGAVAGLLLLLLALFRAQRAQGTVLNQMSDGMVRVDRQGRCRVVNPQAAVMLDQPVQRLLGRNLWKVFPEGTTAGLERLCETALASGQPQRMELHLTARNRWFDSRLQPDAKGVSIFFTDTTERKHQEEHQRLTASVFETSNDGIFITDAQLRITSVNPAFTGITGLALDEVQGQGLVVLGLSPQEETYRELLRTLQHHGHWKGELWNRRKNGEVFVERLSLTLVADAAGRVSHHVGVFTDASVLKAHEDELQRIASQDTLTGLANRRLLAEQMKVAIARALRSGRLVAVCYLDLDDFNTTNDTLGHDTGDKVLVAVARRLQAELRAEDTLARLGGDEFVALVNGLDTAAECQTMAHRLLEALQEPIDTGAATVQVTASMGIALYPQDNVNPDTLLRHADQAMCRAKEAGRNRFHVFAADHDRDARSRRDLVHRLWEALEREELRLYYQPKVNWRTGAVLGFEALIRWQHPEQGLLPPAAFLNDLLDGDLEIAIGNWVIGEAMRQWCTWRAEGEPYAAISVNVSSHQLLKPGFVENMAHTLSWHPGFDPQALQVEVLESAAIHDIDQAAVVMRHCQNLGVGFALDDFGTGYSSLNHLRRLPIDTLKVDQGFVRGMLSSQDDRGIVAAVIHLAHTFNREVVAESVETVAHGEALLELGCETVQGYGIARPMPAAEVPAWRRTWRA